jgi:hypothetical protein
MCLSVVVRRNPHAAKRRTLQSRLVVELADDDVLEVAGAPL